MKELFTFLQPNTELQKLITDQLESLLGNILDKEETINDNPFFNELKEETINDESFFEELKDETSKTILFNGIWEMLLEANKKGLVEKIQLDYGENGTKGIIGYLLSSNTTYKWVNGKESIERLQDVYKEVYAILKPKPTYSWKSYNDWTKANTEYYQKNGKFPGDHYDEDGNLDVLSLNLKMRFSSNKEEEFVLVDMTDKDNGYNLYTLKDKNGQKNQINNKILRCMEVYTKDLHTSSKTSLNLDDILVVGTMYHSKVYRSF